MEEKRCGEGIHKVVVGGRGFSGRDVFKVWSKALGKKDKSVRWLYEGAGTQALDLPSSLDLLSLKFLVVLLLLLLLLRGLKNKTKKTNYYRLCYSLSVTEIFSANKLRGSRLI